MSDVSQGPGWWQASDAKWYPPEQVPGGPAADVPFPSAAPAATPFPGAAPGTVPFPGAAPAGYGPPAGAPGGYGYAPMQKNNGLAIASLVCSLVWVFGLGAVLAIIFGIIARGQIKNSGGAQKGTGLALAGIIIGIVGIVGVIVFWVSVAVVCSHPGNCTVTTSTY